MTRLKKILKWVGGMTVGLIALALVAPLFVSADFLKNQLIAQVKRATGRDLLIQGDVSLSLFPEVGIDARDVTLGNPAGFASPYLVHIGRLKTGAELKPLLSRQLQVSGVEVEDATLYLEENASGSRNWTFALPTQARKAEEKSGEKSAANLSPQFTMGDIVLKNSDVHYRAPGKKPLNFDEISLRVRGADGKRPFVVDGSMRYQDKAVQASLSVESLSQLLAKTTPVTVTLSVPATEFTFKGMVGKKTTIEAHGTLSLSSDNLPQLIGWATAAPAPSGLPQKVSIETEMVLLGDESVALNELKVALDALSANGKLAIAWGAAVPAIRGVLQIPILDVNAWGVEKPATKGASGGASIPVAEVDQEGWSDVPFDFSPLKAVNTDLDLVIGTLQTGQLTVSDIKAKLGIANGALRLALANAVLYEGKASGDIIVSSAGTPSLASNLQLQHVGIDPLMTALSGQSRLKGRADMALTLATKGNSERAMVSSLGGSGKLSVADGAVKGVNIAQLLRDAKKGFLFGEQTTKTTDFTEFSASFTVAQGVLSNSDLSLKSPALRLGGNGTVNLLERRVSYRLVPSIAVTSKGQGGAAEVTGVTVPLLITGPWSNPNVTPDVAGILQENLKNPEALKQNLKDFKSTLKEFNSPKDITRALLGAGGAASAVATSPAAAGVPAVASEPVPAEKPKTKELLKQGLSNFLNQR